MINFFTVYLNCCQQCMKTVDLRVFVLTKKKWNENTYHMKHLNWCQAHSNLNAVLKRHVMANECKLIMPVATCILVCYGHTHLCMYTSLDKCIRFGSSQTKWSCCKIFLGDDITFCIVTSWQTGYGRVFFIIMLLIFTLLQLLVH